MAQPGDSRTHVTLLGRLAQSGDPGQAAWAEFVEHYGRKVLQWCLRWGLHPADAEDVAQSVLLKLSGRMKDFAYDPSKSFRAWLKTVTHHAWRDFLDARQRAAVADGGSAALERLHTAEARDDLEKRMEETFDQGVTDRAITDGLFQLAP